MYGAVELEPVKVILGCAPFSQTVVVPTILAVGSGFKEVEIRLEVPVQPLAETTTENVPALLIEIDCVFEPEFHRYESNCVVLKIILCPGHKFEGPFAVITG